MIPVQLRIALLIICAAALIYVILKIRSSKLNISDSIFWIITAAILLLLALFPGIASFFASLIGIRTPLNFILIIIIGILLLKVFLMSAQISHQNEKINTLAQHIAFLEFDQKKCSPSEKSKPEEGQ